MSRVETDEYGFLGIRNGDGTISISDSMGGGISIPTEATRDDAAEAIVTFIRRTADDYAEEMASELFGDEDDTDDDDE